jgi:DNA helicase HerA-like ATPase
LGEAVYERRRQDGLIDPLVSFIFDEADEFVRSETSGTYADSREIAETLARRGRKFGLGLGIATQRIRYLDTSIMAQPHTYFVSKLPRMTDRQAVAEAFGVGEDFLNQTFKFKKGMWLLMSHDATGLEAIPVPVKTPDANRRLSDWLRKTYGPPAA